MTADVVPTGAVSLHVWRVPPARAGSALGRMPLLGRDARRAAGARFVKVLGTADRRFTPRGATPTRWALLATWASSDAAERFDAGRSLRWWHTHAAESARLTLRPLHSRGRWDGRSPFGDGDDPAWRGPVVGLTRSTVRARRALAFYRAVPAIAADVESAPGLRFAFGIGEAPLLRQGTLSAWDDQAAMTTFVRTGAHTAAVRATPTVGWYVEELFARLALVDGTGSVDGRGVAP